MKKCLVSIACILLAAVSAFGQAKVPATLVSVVDTNFDVIELSTANQYFAPTGRTWATSQHCFDAIDDYLVLVDSFMTNLPMSSLNWQYVMQPDGTNWTHWPQSTWDWLDDNWAMDNTNWLFLADNPALNWTGATVYSYYDINPANSNYVTTIDSNATLTQAVFDFIDDKFVEWGAYDGLLKGTNIVGATYTNGQWTADTSMTDTMQTNVFTGSGTSYQCSGTNWAFSEDTKFRYCFVGSIYNPGVVSNIFEMRFYIDKDNGQPAFFRNAAEFRGLPMYTFEIDPAAAGSFVVTNTADYSTYLASPYAACYLFTHGLTNGEFNRIISVDTTNVTLELPIVSGTGFDRIQMCGGIGQFAIPEGTSTAHIVTSVSAPGGEFLMQSLTTDEGLIVISDRGW